jgi:flagellar basal body-associated protein FliL
MALDDMHTQHQFWSKHGDQVPEISLEGKMWLLVALVVGTFACLGYVFWLVIEKEKKEQKNK